MLYKPDRNNLQVNVSYKDGIISILAYNNSTNFSTSFVRAAVVSREILLLKGVMAGIF